MSSRSGSPRRPRGGRGGRGGYQPQQQTQQHQLYNPSPLSRSSSSSAVQRTGYGKTQVPASPKEEEDEEEEEEDDDDDDSDDSDRMVEGERWPSSPPSYRVERGGSGQGDRANFGFEQTAAAVSPPPTTSPRPPLRTPRQSAGSAFASAPATASPRAPHTPSSSSALPHTPPPRFVGTPIRNVQNSSPVFRRSATFGSPGLRRFPVSSPLRGTAGGPGGSGRDAETPEPEQAAALTRTAGPRRRFVRRKPLGQRLLALPIDLFHRLQALVLEHLTLSDAPALAYPLALLFHLIHFLAHVARPVGIPVEFGGAAAPLITGQPEQVARPVRQGTSLFGGKKAKWSRQDEIRRLRKGQRDAWIGWMSFLVSFSLLAISFLNALYLFTRKRTYRMVLRDERNPIDSPNARLAEMDFNMEPPEKEPLSVKVKKLGLHHLLRLPVLGTLLRWFVSDPYEVDELEARQKARVQTLEVWQPEEFYLRLFCVYSPAHALFYHFGHLLGLNSRGWWLALVMMALFGWQTKYLAERYARLVKDRSIVSAEVMNEYNEKFVYPTAMPSMRDASAQTDEQQLAHMFPSSPSSSSLFRSSRAFASSPFAG